MRPRQLQMWQVRLSTSGQHSAPGQGRPPSLSFSPPAPQREIDDIIRLAERRLEHQSHGLVREASWLHPLEAIQRAEDRPIDNAR
jgi:hypothetical protein